MRPLLIFDGDCAFCTSSAQFLARRVRPTAEIRPYQRVDLPALGLTEPECAAAVQFVAADGSVLSGNRAVMAVLRLGRVPWPLIGLVGDLRAVRPAAGWAYRWIAAHRDRLPGGTPACAVGGP